MLLDEFAIAIASNPPFECAAIVDHRFASHEFWRRHTMTIYDDCCKLKISPLNIGFEGSRVPTSV